MATLRDEFLSIEQCQVLKTLGFPQVTSYWYLEWADNVIIGLEKTIAELNEIGEPDGYVCEKIIACPYWAELQDWLGTDMHIRGVGDGSGLYEAHIDNGPTVTGYEPNQIAYKIVMMVKNVSLE